MKFFKLDYSLDKKIIGRAEGEKSCLFDGYRFKEDSFSNQGLFGPVVGNPALPMPIMHKSVKMTDFIGLVAMLPEYLIITKKFLDFLIPHFDTSYQTWKISIKKGDVNYEYYILHLDYPKSDFINYDKSTFKLFEDLAAFQYKDLDQEIKITSDVDFLDKCREFPGLYGIPELQSTKIVLNTSNQEVDFFRCAHNGMAGYYVSERLKEAILENGFTGMRFEEIEEIQNRVVIEYV